MFWPVLSAGPTVVAVVFTSHMCVEKFGLHTTVNTHTHTLYRAVDRKCVRL